VGDLQSMLLGEHLEELFVVDEAARDGDMAGELAGGLGLVEDAPELIVIDEAEIDEHLPDPALARRATVFPAPRRGLLARRRWRLRSRRGGLGCAGRRRFCPRSGRRT